MSQRIPPNENRGIITTSARRKRLDESVESRHQRRAEVIQAHRETTQAAMALQEDLTESNAVFDVIMQALLTSHVLTNGSSQVINAIISIIVLMLDRGYITNNLRQGIALVQPDHSQNLHEKIALAGDEAIRRFLLLGPELPTRQQIDVMFGTYIEYAGVDLIVDLSGFFGETSLFLLGSKDWPHLVGRLTDDQILTLVKPWFFIQFDLVTVEELARYFLRPDLIYYLFNNSADFSDEGREWLRQKLSWARD